MSTTEKIRKMNKSWWLIAFFALFLFIPPTDCTGLFYRMTTTPQQREFDSLKKDLSHKSRAVRLKALKGLAQHGEAAVPLLMDVLQDDEPESRSVAAQSLETIGGPAVEPLVELLDTDDWHVQATVIAVLSGIGKPALKALGRELQTGDHTVQIAAARIAANLGPDALELVPDLIAALRSSNAEYRRLAATAIGAVGPAAVEAVEDLVRVSTDFDPDVRLAAVRALGQLAVKPDVVLGALATALEDRDKRVRLEAIRSIEAFGSRGLAAREALKHAASSDDVATATGAANALQKLNNAPTPEQPPKEAPQKPDEKKEP